MKLNPISECRKTAALLAVSGRCGTDTMPPRCGQRKSSRLMIWILGILLLSVDNAQSAGIFNADTWITLRIDRITNLTNPGNPVSLDIRGHFFLDQSGSYEFSSGDGASVLDYFGGTLGGPVSAGGTFSQHFSLSGSTGNGAIETFYSTLGDLVFDNRSADDYEVRFSLFYDLSAEASGGILSEVTAGLNYSDESGAYAGYREVFASSFGPGSDFLSNAFAPDSFALTIAAFGRNAFYSDLSLSGYAEATVVPLPPAGWLLLSGLVPLLGLVKQPAKAEGEWIPYQTRWLGGATARAR